MVCIWGVGYSFETPNEIGDHLLDSGSLNNPSEALENDAVYF